MRPWQPRPLITFALFSYNQERFVRAAVRGALLQTYSPLEIICSDDASSDLTADVVRDELTSYSGEHTIHFNVNATNLGIADHLSHVLNKARGELVVVAAGDDVSFPERTEMLFQAWSREGRKVMSLFSGYELIDVSGRVLRTVSPYDGYHRAGGRQRIAGNAPVEGATHAFSKQLYDDFGDLLPGTLNEDVVIQFRAFLRDGVYILTQPLAQYRKHADGLTAISESFGHLDAADRAISVERSHLTRYRTNLANFKKDTNIAMARTWLSLDRGQCLSVEIQRQIAVTDKRLQFYRAAKPHRWKAGLAFVRSPTPVRIILRDMILIFLPWLFVCLRYAKGQIRQFWRFLIPRRCSD